MYVNKIQAIDDIVGGFEKYICGFNKKEIIIAGCRFVGMTQHNISKLLDMNESEVSHIESRIMKRIMHKFIRQKKQSEKL